jgi:Xaa-Pro aminopeptidase
VKLRLTPALVLLPFAAPILDAAPDAVPPEEFAARRGEVLASMERSGGERAFLLLRAPPPDNFAEDVDYPYRPDNDLYYLTGIADPGCALLLSVRELEGKGREVLFIDPPVEWMQLWVGDGMTPEEAGKRSGIPPRAVLRLAELASSLVELGGAPGRSPHGPGPHHALPGAAPPAKPAFFFAAAPAFRPGEVPTEPFGFLLQSLGSRAFHLDLRPPAAVIHPLRQVKSPREVALIRRAIAATVAAIRNAARIARPGIHEYELRAAIEGTFLAEGTGGWSFPPIVATGPNTCVLHYGKYGRRIAEGDLVLLDIGAEEGFYAADVTRTFPAGGRFTPRQRAVYEIVLRAQEAGIRAARPGATSAAVHEAAFAEIAAGLRALGLAEDAAGTRKLFPHFSSHGLGLAVHDPMPVETLKPGMVITVEPGIYIRDEGLGVRIEDDILITEDGAEVLSAAAPRSPAEVEAMVREKEF